VYPRKKWLDFGFSCPNYPQESQQCKMCGFGGGSRSLIASDILPLAALFHLDNLIKCVAVPLPRKFLPRNGAFCVHSDT